MAQRKIGRVFAEAARKTVESIEYTENADWHALVITFRDGKDLSFEISARVVVEATHLEKRRGDLKLIRKYGRLSGGAGQKV
jgi:hypothetical protein